MSETIEEFFSDSAPEHLTDEITFTIYVEPVVIRTNGRTISRPFIIKNNMKDPFSQKVLTKEDLIPNKDKVKEIEFFLDRKISEFLKNISKTPASRILQFVRCISSRDDLSACVKGRRQLISNILSKFDEISSLLGKIIKEDTNFIDIFFSSRFDPEKGASIVMKMEKNPDISKLLSKEIKQKIGKLEVPNSEIPTENVNSNSNYVSPSDGYWAVWVGPLPNPITDNEIQEEFEQFGPVHSIKYGKERKFCFVNFYLQSDAADAHKSFESVSLQGQKIPVFRGFDSSPTGNASEQPGMERVASPPPKSLIPELKQEQKSPLKEVPAKKVEENQTPSSENKKENQPNQNRNEVQPSQEKKKGHKVTQEEEDEPDEPESAQGYKLRNMILFVIRCLKKFSRKELWKIGSSTKNPNGDLNKASERVTELASSLFVKTLQAPVSEYSYYDARAPDYYERENMIEIRRENGQTLINIGSFQKKVVEELEKIFQKLIEEADEISMNVKKDIFEILYDNFENWTEDAFDDVSIDLNNSNNLMRIVGTQEDVIEARNSLLRKAVMEKLGIEYNESGTENESEGSEGESEEESNGESNGESEDSDYSQITIELKFPTSTFFRTRTDRQMEALCEEFDVSSLEISGNTLTLEDDNESISIAEEMLKLKLFCSTKIFIPVQFNIERAIAKLKKERKNIQCQYGYLGIDDIQKKIEEKVQGISATLVGVFKKDFDKAKNKITQVCNLPKDVIHMTTAKYQKIFPTSQDQKTFENQNDVDLFYNKKNSLHITATYQKNLDAAKRAIFKKLEEFKKEK